MARKRNDGWYQTSVVVGRNRDGSYKRKYIYAKTKWELDERRAELEHNLKYGLSADADKATFDEIGQEWLKHKRFFVDDSRYNRYEAVLRTHLDSIARMPVIKLKTIHIQNILDEKAAEGYSKKVLSEIKQTAKQVLDYAMQYDIVMRNVAYLSKVPKNAPEEHRDPLTDAQIQLVLNHWQGNRMGVPALIMLYCGLRKGEMIALQWSHINLKDKTIFVEKSASSTKNQPKVKGPKTKAGLRIVPIPDFLADILRDCAKRKESMFVCPAAGGTMMTEQAWKNAWTAICTI
jgi:integrase